MAIPQNSLNGNDVLPVVVLCAVAETAPPVEYARATADRAYVWLL